MQSIDQERKFFHFLNHVGFRYPSTEYPVLAFSGPPGSFPGKFYSLFKISFWCCILIYLAHEHNIPLVKYFVYSDYIREKAEKFLNKHQISPDTLLAIHLRNGMDFVSRWYSKITDYAREWLDLLVQFLHAWKAKGKRREFRGAYFACITFALHSYFLVLLGVRAKYATLKSRFSSLG